MLQNLNKNSILDFLYVILACMQSGLWKKQLVTFFVKHFTESHKNTTCIDFQVHNPKLSQDGCFKMYIYYKRLCIGCFTKEAIDSFFCKALYRKWWNTICVVFQFYNQKLNLEVYFKPYVYYTRLCTGRSTKELTDSFFRRAL